MTNSHPDGTTACTRRRTTGCATSRPTSSTASSTGCATIDVAAYSAPTAGKRGPYGDTVLPGGTERRVWVDSRRRDEARELTDRYLDEVAAEVAWAGIVADFDLESTDEVPALAGQRGPAEPAAREGTPDGDPAESSTTYPASRSCAPRPPAPPVGAPATRTSTSSRRRRRRCPSPTRSAASRGPARSAGRCCCWWRRWLGLPLGGWVGFARAGRLHGRLRHARGPDEGPSPDRLRARRRRSRLAATGSGTEARACTARPSRYAAT